MAIAHRNTQTAASTASGQSTLTITKPTGLTVDDYMLLWFMANNNSTSGSWGTPTWPSGFSSISEINVSGGGAWNKVWLATKFADSGDVAASNFGPQYTESGGPYCLLGGITAYSGVDTTNPYDGVTPVTAQDATGSDNNIVASSITPANANSKLLVGLFGITDGNNSTDTRTITVPGSMTERGQINGYSSAFARIALADEAYASASATGTRTATFSGGTAKDQSILLLLRELVVSSTVTPPGIEARVLRRRVS